MSNEAPHPLTDATGGTLPDAAVAERSAPEASQARLAVRRRHAEEEVVTAALIAVRRRRELAETLDTLAAKPAAAFSARERRRAKVCEMEAACAHADARLANDVARLEEIYKTQEGMETP